MTTLSSLRSGIKSIQAGTIQISNGASTNTATISSVNTAKSFVLPGGGMPNASGVEYGRFTLTNSTTVTIDRGGTNQGSLYTYTVVEFN